MDKRTKPDSTVDVYQICDWEKHFEGAKTKTYNNKTTCSMPNKHGLGYRRLIRSENGVALFGAWCSLVQILSRHEKPRQGYCTDTGGIHGRPYTPNDLEMLTDIKAGVFSQLFPVVQSIGWIKVTQAKDTTGILQAPAVSPRYPLNSDSDSDSDSSAASGEVESYDDSSISKPSPRFKKPTVPEVEAYVKERVASGAAQIDAGAFCDFYDSKGWKVGKTPMKCWKAAVRTWQNKRREEEPKSRPMRGF